LRLAAQRQASHFVARLWDVDARVDLDMRSVTDRLEMSIFALLNRREDSGHPETSTEKKLFQKSGNSQNTTREETNAKF
jgi:hypothetical protein